MLEEEINTKTQVKIGNRVYEASELFKLFDVRGLKYELLEEEVI